MPASTNGHLPIKLAPFVVHGADLSAVDSNNWKGDCVFCGKSDHFFVKDKTGQWDCKHCGKKGNLVTFLGYIAEKTFRETARLDWDRLVKTRGLPVECFKTARMGWTGLEWILPIYSDTGTVRDIRKYNGKKFITTKGCNVQLFGLNQLARFLGEKRKVWICEGEWDAMALRWLLDMAGQTADVVVGVPGADIMKDDWVKWFAGHDAILCYDNDEAGDRGSLAAGAKLVAVASSVQYLSWPDSRPLGWDIRDFVIEGRGKGITAEQGFKLLEMLVRPNHRRAELSPESATAQFTGVIPTFDEVIKVMTKWLKMDEDLKDALAIVLAVACGNEVSGEPLWMYIIGPPGSGKTVLLMALKASHRIFFRSTLTAKSLVSGFNTHPDPSLLPHMNGKTAVFKDGTELLTAHPDEKREMYSVLRGAFDGCVNKSFGNGVKRDYEDLKFNVLIGVTPAIHGDSQATMGERFLKFEMREDRSTVEYKIMKAISNIKHEVEMESEVADVCGRFLERVVKNEDLKGLSSKCVDRIVALSQVLAIMRAQVDRETFGERDVKYRPSHEIGTRIAKQLAKFAQILTVIFGLKETDERVMGLIEKIVLDTMVGFHADLVCAILSSGANGMTRDIVAKSSKVPVSTANRRLQDLEHLGVIFKVYGSAKDDRPGPKPAVWHVTEGVRKLWVRAQLPVG